MRILRSIAIASLLCAVVSPFSFAGSTESEDDFTIRPGIGLGSVKLGMNKAQIEKLIGKPDGTYSMPGGIQAEYSQWKEPDSTQTLRVFFDSTGKAIQLACEQTGNVKEGQNKLITADGIRLGSSSADVMSKYSPLQKFKYQAKDSHIDYYDQIKRGIAFEFTRAESEGESTKRLYAILVHVPGKRVIADADERPVTH